MERIIKTNCKKSQQDELLYQNNYKSFQMGLLNYEKVYLNETKANKY